jgi:hypothetical protein
MCWSVVDDASRSAHIPAPLLLDSLIPIFVIETLCKCLPSRQFMSGYVSNIVR